MVDTMGNQHSRLSKVVQDFVLCLALLGVKPRESQREATRKPKESALGLGSSQLSRAEAKGQPKGSLGEAKGKSSEHQKKGNLKGEGYRYERQAFGFIPNMQNTPTDGSKSPGEAWGWAQFH